MTNLKITCDGERIYLQLDSEGAFLLADTRENLLEALKDRLDLASGVLDVGGTCEILFGEIDDAPLPRG